MQRAEKLYRDLLYDDPGRAVAARVITQPRRELTASWQGDCAYYTVMNFYLLWGLEPPSLDEMKRTVSPSAGGLTLYQIQALLVEMSFPRLVFYGSLPLTLTWRDVLPAALASGYSFILGYQDISVIDEDDARLIGDADFEGVQIAQPHAAVPFATNDYGISAITAAPGLEIAMLSWDLYPTMPVHPWRADPEINRRRGLTRDFVTVEPINRPSPRLSFFDRIRNRFK